MQINLSDSQATQIEHLAQQLGRSPENLVAMAVERFIQSYAFSREAGTRVIHQGDVYWVTLMDEGEPGIPHPHVVIQDDLLNHSRISTVVTCGLTTNLGRVHLPGNVPLEVGEGNLEKRSVVEVSKVSSVEKAHLGDYIGRLSAERVEQIWAGMRFLQRSFFTR
jgi:mRNA interferase MazF